MSAAPIRDGIKFSSGRKIYVHADIVGIDGDGGLYNGYDGYISWPSDESNEDPLSVEDMRELADMMIDRWTKFRDSLVESKPGT